MPEEKPVPPVIPGPANHVFLHPNGYIEVQTIGIQSTDSVVAMGSQIAELAKKLRAEGKKVYVLDNLQQLALKQPGEVPKAVAAEANRLDFDKVAMLGTNNRMLKYGTNFILRAVGKMEKMKYFTDRVEAERWFTE